MLCHAGNVGCSRVSSKESMWLQEMCRKSCSHAMGIQVQGEHLGGEVKTSSAYAWEPHCGDDIPILEQIIPAAVDEDKPMLEDCLQIATTRTMLHSAIHIRDLKISSEPPA